MQKRRKVRYFDASRRLAAAYVFVAPLVAVYELGVALDPEARNGADPIFRELFHRFGQLGVIFLNLVLLGLLFLAIWRTKAERIRIPGLYGLMFLESCGWAAAMLLVAFLFPPQPLSLPVFAREVVASLGAGIYEEVLFRFLLMGGLILVLHRGLGGGLAWVVPIAIVASALLFSWAHHGVGGDPWDEKVFAFRAMMGVVLGLLFWGRGLGIVVYAHALYNVALVIRYA
ncbi:MAG: CPBP family glutamic-type intramembrane protease [Planctomycetota bacterium]